jgi:hypothetical protein
VGEYFNTGRGSVPDRMAGLLMWRAQAACLDVDPRIFHDKNTVSEALAVCAECPVVRQCADYRVRVERERGGAAVGVWGGQVWLEDTTALKAKAGSLT